MSSKIYVIHNKTTVLQEINNFNKNVIENQQCISTLTDFLYIVHQGENINSEEGTKAFYATTKLFVTHDVELRKIIYLSLKELNNLTQDAFIITSSLIKDINSNLSEIRGPAIRVLMSISDDFQAIERYVKQAILDDNPAVKSAGLVSALHMSNDKADFVRGLTWEAQEAIKNRHPMVSYHALGLLTNLKNASNQSLKKLVANSIKNPSSSAYFLSYLIRLSAKFIKEKDEDTHIFIEFISKQMRNHTEMVNYEAAHAILNLNIENLLVQALNSVQLFCESSKPHFRMAGIKTLAAFIDKNTKIWASITIHVEDMIMDTNESVAWFAVKTSLATCNEGAVEKLMEKLTKCINNTSYEFKISIINATRELCKQYPNKHQSIFSFLAEMLHRDCNVDCKATIIDTMITLAETYDDEKENCLIYLCEFLEDCEPRLALCILSFLGREGPKSNNVYKYIRCIHNRMILDSSLIRATALHAMVQFGVQRPELLSVIKTLLAQSYTDDDNDVRERAIYYAIILGTNDNDIIKKNIICNYSLNREQLRIALIKYLNTYPNGKDINSLLYENETYGEAKYKNLDNQESKDMFSAIPEIEKLGNLRKTSKQINLTENDMEYIVTCTKHVFPKHLILQFECVNTMTDALHEVTVDLQELKYYKVVSVVPCKEILCNNKGSIYIVLQFPENPKCSTASFKASLQFLRQEYNTNNGLIYEYPDLYVLEDVVIKTADQFKMTDLNCEEIWNDELLKEVKDTFILPYNQVIQSAMGVCDYFELPHSVINGDLVKEIHVVFMSRDKSVVAIKCRMVSSEEKVLLELSIRAMKQEVGKMILYDFCGVH